MLALVGCVGLDDNGGEVTAPEKSMSSSSTGGVTLAWSSFVRWFEVMSVSPYSVSTGGDQFVGTRCRGSL